MVPEIERGCAWMNIRGAKNEFHPRVDSNFYGAKITNYIVGTPDMIVGFGRLLSHLQHSRCLINFSMANVEVLVRSNIH
jgi:hypothetical protein